MGTQESEALLRGIPTQEAELPDLRPQAELGNEDKSRAKNLTRRRLGITNAFRIITYLCDNFVESDG
jgi:hypothetical protein